eukprot:scaffold5118_cov118-Isochrysis_galbana.AAC.2
MSIEPTHADIHLKVLQRNGAQGERRHQKQANHFAGCRAVRFHPPRNLRWHGGTAPCCDLATLHSICLAHGPDEQSPAWHFSGVTSASYASAPAGSPPGTARSHSRSCNAPRASRACDRPGMGELGGVRGMGCALAGDRGEGGMGGVRTSVGLRVGRARAPRRSQSAAEANTAGRPKSNGRAGESVHSGPRRAWHPACVRKGGEACARRLGIVIGRARAPGVEAPLGIDVRDGDLLRHRDRPERHDVEQAVGVDGGGGVGPAGVVVPAEED